MLGKDKIAVTYIAWLAAALFFMYQYALRIFPGLLVDNIQSDFQIRADEFALLGSTYLVMYSIVQLPFGILVDKYGVRKVLLSCITLCIISSGLFAFAESYNALLISRILAGIGSAPALLCALKIVADNLPEGRRGLLMGMSLSLGTVGAMIFGQMIVYVMQEIGWRHTINLLALIGLLLLALVYIFVGKQASNKPPKIIKVKYIVREILSILKNKAVMIYACLALSLYAPLSVLADLWGTAFLKQKFMLTGPNAAYLVPLMYIGFSVGSVIIPSFAEKKGLMKQTIALSSVSLLILFGALTYGPALPYSTLIVSMLAVGFLCGAEVICFTGALQSASSNNSGEVIGVVNTLNMLGGAVLQQLVGVVLDLGWQGHLNIKGSRMYTTETFMNSMSILIFTLLVSASLSVILLKKK